LVSTHLRREEEQAEIGLGRYGTGWRWRAFSKETLFMEVVYIEMLHLERE
jgi:hypothetical protein